MNPQYPKLVLQVGQQTITVADELDFKLDLIDDLFFWDEGEYSWKENGPSDYLTRRMVECLNRMKYEKPE